jgi:phenylpropionate dioxygenase-like ring-hydroxylating dioxygenase large terminal subunit
MGRLLREFWIPAIPSSAVGPDGMPYRLRLLGEYLVVFRDSDGKVGVLDEACPHRGASLALARNEDCGLRCIYHGWKLDVTGQVVETPRERDLDYGRRIPAGGHPTVERSGIIWTYLGSRRPAPPLPPYPFATLPPEQVGTLCIPVRINWLVGLEAAFDPTHVPVLHQSSLNPSARVAPTLIGIPAYESFEVDRQAYGSRMAQVVPLGDDVDGIRMKEYVFPFMRMNSQTAHEDADLVVFGQVPMDDESMMFWFIVYNHDRPPTELGYPIQARGPTGIREMPLGREHNWGQDRQAMKTHFSGLSVDEPAIAVVIEDLAVLESMALTLDRTRHHLTPGDGMITKCRHVMRAILNDYERQGTVPDHSGVADLRPRFLEVPRGHSWRDYYPGSVLSASTTTSSAGGS